MSAWQWVGAVAIAWFAIGALGRWLEGVDSPAPAVAATDLPRVYVGVRDNTDSETTVQRTITAREFGERWPFRTADEATILCIPSLGELGGFVVVAGRPFAATGGAKVAADRHRLTFGFGDGHWRRASLFGDDPDVDDYWRTAAPGVAGADPLKVNFGPIIDAIEGLRCARS